MEATECGCGGFGCEQGVPCCAVAPRVTAAHAAVGWEIVEDGRTAVPVAEAVARLADGTWLVGAAFPLPHGSNFAWVIPAPRTGRAANRASIILQRLASAEGYARATAFGGPLWPGAAKGWFGDARDHAACVDPRHTSADDGGCDCLAPHACDTCGAVERDHACGWTAQIEAAAGEPPRTTNDPEVCRMCGGPGGDHARPCVVCQEHRWM